MSQSISYRTLTELLQVYKTPFYFYSKGAIKKTVDELRSAFPVENFQLLFATMANDNPEFLRIIAANDVGACVNSIKHLNLAIDNGIKQSRIQFTSTGVSGEDMIALLRKGVAVNFDSLQQLERWFQLQQGGYAGVRINTASLTNKVLVTDRLGIEGGQLYQALEIAKRNKGTINGMHIYVGTNYRNHSEMMPPLEAFFELAATVPSLDYVNIGGGVGVDYMNEGNEFDLKEYGLCIKKLIEGLRRKLKKNVRLIFEPGRRLAASSGWFVTRITDIKKLNNTRYIVVDASVSVFPRPFHHPDSPHRAITPFKNGELGFEDSVVVGKTTFSKDILSKSSLSCSLEEGDVVVFDQAGAYCDSMRSKFLGQLEPENVFVE